MLPRIECKSSCKLQILSAATDIFTYKSLYLYKPWYGRSYYSVPFKGDHEPAECPSSEDDFFFGCIDSAGLDMARTFEIMNHRRYDLSDWMSP